MSGVYEKVYYELHISRSFLRCNWRLLRGQNFSLVSLGFLITGPDGYIFLLLLLGKHFSDLQRYISAHRLGIKIGESSESTSEKQTS